jgi:signal peptidase I
LQHSVACSGEEFADLSHQLLGRGLQMRFSARGESMRPFVQDGDVLVVEPAGAWRPRLGDVLFYRDSEGAICAHRLVRLRRLGGKSLLVTRGDNALGSDEVLRPGQVLGRIIAIERAAGSVRLDTMRARAIACMWGWLSPQSARLRPLLRRHRWLLRFVPRP